MAVTAYTQARSDSTSLSKKEDPAEVKTLPLDLIVEKTRLLESSNGTKGLAATCKAKGLSNDYGYAPPNCYPKGKDTELVHKWFTEKLAEMTLQEANCLYTTGIRTADCQRNVDFGI